MAKAIKEAGYPQDIAKEEYLFDINGKPSTGFEQGEEFVRPTYLEVWLWLWREKKINVTPIVTSGIIEFWSRDGGIHFDPEEAVIAAIEHLVNNKLLK